MDWKDALSKLKDSGELPSGEDDSAAEEAESAEKESSKKSGTQHTEKLHIVVEKKGRKGKTATIIEGFACDDEELNEIARILKTRIGTGGSARGGEILLQGDFRDKAKEILKELGFLKIV